jgi:hypothetical protein
MNLIYKNRLLSFSQRLSKALPTYSRWEKRRRKRRGEKESSRKLKGKKTLLLLK